MTTRRDFTDVRDVVAAYRLLVTGGAPGTVYNVCSGRDVSMAEVAEQLLVLAGADLVLETDPKLVRPVDVPVLRGDAGRVRDTTGWEPLDPARDDARRRPLLVAGGLRRRDVVGRPGAMLRGRGGGQASPSWRIWDRTSRACSRALTVSWPTVGGSRSSSGCKVVSRSLVADSASSSIWSETLRDTAADVADGLVQREITGKLVVQLDPVHLKALVTEHAQSDGDVGDVAGQVDDVLGHGVRRLR